MGRLYLDDKLNDFAIRSGTKFYVEAGAAINVENGGSFMGFNPTGAADYFVDLNVAATGSGTMDSPYATLAEAITASNTSIGLTANRWWARRNRIFVMGDGITESLTVLPEKCDIIGVGSDLVPFPRIIGVHTIAVNKVGCRFINMGFQATGTGVLMTIPAGCHGFQILGGMMQASAAGNTKALQITDSALVTIQGLRIVQNPSAYGTGIFARGISIEGSGASHQTLIDSNIINANVPFYVDSTALAYDGVFSNNILRAVGLWADENSDKFWIINNRAVTDVDCATYTAGFDINLLTASGNLQTGSNAGDCDTVPHTLFA